MTLFYNVLVEDEAVRSTVSWNTRKLKVYYQSSLVIKQDFFGVYTLLIKKEVCFSVLKCALFRVDPRLQAV